MKNLKIPDLNKILKPIWSHKAGYGWSAELKEWKKQRIKEQATTPEDSLLLKKLGIKRNDNVLAIAGYYASWASKIKEAGTNVTYSDISKSMIDYAKKEVKTKFSNYIHSNYELIPRKINEYDWTFTFEACGGQQGLSIAAIRSLLNRKGCIFVYYMRIGKQKISTGSKSRTYPNIVKKIAQIYKAKYKIKKVNFRAHRKGYAPRFMPHMVFVLFTNQQSKKDAELDLKVLEYIKNKKEIMLEKESSKLNINKSQLKESLKRLNRLTPLMKKEFVRYIGIKQKIDK
ncbi:MAG: hypothetical protein NTX24_04125 [Candidatus Pacearchaeota archaeon]|nr:hypothetical protein [Candidatus Pacearchaeota archaeon]